MAFCVGPADSTYFIAKARTNKPANTVCYSHPPDLHSQIQYFLKSLSAIIVVSHICREPVRGPRLQALQCLVFNLVNDKVLVSDAPRRAKPGDAPFQGLFQEPDPILERGQAYLVRLV